MSKERIYPAVKMSAAILLLSFISLALFTACASLKPSDKLVDQDRQETDRVVESIQSGFAREGWIYTGYEVVDKDDENDTLKVAISYDVDGDPEKILRENTTEKPDNEEIYSLAEDINVKVTVELSAYDKENDALGCSEEFVEWFVGDTEANAWIKEQNSK